ncbi:hypothetical protein AMK26_06125 [Streptomyces sp. CB03234]|uniref:DUF1877 family protein n=1 Tax=Streptomyces sp. (strain CB03234) TaxID=1703937 RepID=UPI00093C45D3|nr:DUF1877 family protein [Streptomyces sp. CB03234]OKK08563.1 hypothetical protein AMK26_06125 [Streptomyces sp. CB03234]
MSYHLHFRAVPEGDVRDDLAWLESFMSAAWDDHPAEYRAGLATSIEKDFGLVDQLYATAGCVDRELPVYGGRPVEYPDGDRPPFLVLPPDQVRSAADFLAGASFEALWETAGDKIRAVFAGWDEAVVKEILLGHHRDLCAFYRRTASAGHAVVKAAWF